MHTYTYCTYMCMCSFSQPLELYVVSVQTSQVWNLIEQRCNQDQTSSFSSSFFTSSHRSSSSVSLGLTKVTLSSTHFRIQARPRVNGRSREKLHHHTAWVCPRRYLFLDITFRRSRRYNSGVVRWLVIRFHF